MPGARKMADGRKQSHVIAGNQRQSQAPYGYTETWFKWFLLQKNLSIFFFNIVLNILSCTETLILHQYLNDYSSYISSFRFSKVGIDGLVKYCKSDAKKFIWTDFKHPLSSQSKYTQDIIQIAT